jgi:starch synthase
MLTSEAVPFAKTGGLADAVPALAAALSEIGHDVRLAMPRYYRVDKNTLNAHPSPLGVPMGTGEMWSGIFETRLPDTDVPVYMFDREDLFGREGLYGPDGSSSWPDNAGRFAFLSGASFQLCRYLGWIPDILHLHDWQAAPAAWILRTIENNTEFAKTASVLTVHNLGYQGVFPASDLKYFPNSLLAGDAGSILLNGDVNFLSAGLRCADAITTVSPTYAREILEPEYSEGLGRILAPRKNRITGILNGMDYDEWNPSDDSALSPDNYGIADMAGKKRLKERLQREIGLDVNPDIPLFGVVTRLTGQKGIDLITDPHGPVRDFLRDGGGQLAVLGTGETRYEAEMTAMAEALPGRAAVRVAFSNPFSRLIEGGSDFFLMPSRYEPCGLNQMYSLRYGTLPVVRRTGGLADTVMDLDEHPRKGNGFVFDAALPNNLADAMRRAANFYGKKTAMDSACKRAMKARFDWKGSAKEYAAVFKKALSRRS